MSLAVGKRVLSCVRRFSSTNTPHSRRKMVGKPPVLPKVERHEITRLFKLDVQEPAFHGNESEMGENVYGGLLFAQGLGAAELDVDKEFLPTSIHSLFVNYPFAKFPIDYNVEKLRDGKSFCARSIKGVQNDNVVFAAIANFSRSSPTSIHHTVPLPNVKKPEEVTDFFDYCEQRLEDINNGKLKVPKMLAENFERRLFDKPYSVLDIRPIEPELHFILQSYSNVPLRYWIKASIPLGDDPKLHRLILCYLSDMFLVGAAIYPHLSQGNLFSMVASLDNTLWFHSYEFRADDWLLYEVQSPIADSGRAVSYGKVWTQDGKLIASTAQEVLTRFKGESKL